MYAMQVTVHELMSERAWSW